MVESLMSNCKSKTIMFRLILSLLIMYVSVLFSQSFIVYAYEGIPEKVRIGLMFNDPQTGQYSAVSSFTVDSKKAFNLGISRKRALRAFLKSLPVMRLL